jgi:competence CoiA-like predicted nuclease
MIEINDKEFCNNIIKKFYKCNEILGKFPEYLYLTNDYFHRLYDEITLIYDDINDSYTIKFYNHILNDISYLKIRVLDGTDESINETFMSYFTSTMYILYDVNSGNIHYYDNDEIFFLDYEDEDIDFDDLF